MAARHPIRLAPLPLSAINSLAGRSAYSYRPPVLKGQKCAQYCMCGQPINFRTLLSPLWGGREESLREWSANRKLSTGHAVKS
jgi:hypothetical protein